MRGRGENLVYYLADLLALGKEHISSIFQYDRDGHGLINCCKMDILSVYLCGDLAQSRNFTQLQVRFHRVAHSSRQCRYLGYEVQP